jgi:hypothetical protein
MQVTSKGILIMYCIKIFLILDDYIFSVVDVGTCSAYRKRFFFFLRGLFEFDDMFHNAFGVILGYGIRWIFPGKLGNA